ncbi:MAG: ABC transporter ATP-binding protein [Phycisphaerae bacterium]|nr:ABC transporter ATP-binding protein [Phycisphaerae bacterium]
MSTRIIGAVKALAIRNLHKTYANGTEALRGIDLDVEEGEFFGLLGPNGAGKSTAIGIITSLVNRTGGDVKIFGVDLARDPGAAKRLIGMVPQEFNFNVFESVGQIVAQQAGYYGLPRRLAHERAEKYLRKMGLWGKRDTRSRDLSGGMKRRLMIARALVHEPRLLILDEPTAGVDIELRRSTWALMQEFNEQGTTVILTTHYLEEAESLCRRIAIIDHGRIIEDMDKKALLATLHRETFVLDLARPLGTLPAIDDHVLRLIDPTTLEVDLASGDSLSRVFVDLEKQDISVLSMRNKANRLEELFVSLVENGGRDD